MQSSNSSPVFGTIKPVVCKSDRSSAGPNSQIPACPRCHSKKIWRNGHYSTDRIQRWSCRDCEKRFCDPKDLQNHKKQLKEAQRIESMELKSASALTSSCQISVTETKNLVAEQQQTEVLRRSEAEVTNGKIVEYEFWLLKQGYATETIRCRIKVMKRLSKLGANLLDPESVKEIIAKQPWSPGRKEYVVDTYSSFLKLNGGKWEPPRYQRIEKIPFIPTEQEIDQLIAACGEKTAALLQTLKETAIRVGEAWKLKWTDIDPVNSTISITPEKHSHARMFKISSKLLAMIMMLPRTSDKIFGTYELRGYRGSFVRQRKRTASKLQNPRINQITFHTFRHWKATMEYHKTKDILHVMRMLGHKNIKNTLIYTQLVTFENDDYSCKAADTVKEAKELIEAGYEYVCEMDGLKLFKKRK